MRPFNPQPTTPEAKRLVAIYNDFSGTRNEFCDLIGTSLSSLSRMMNSQQPITYEVIKTLCVKLGYAPDWIITGSGPKKGAGNNPKLITEISMLRTEIDIAQKRIDVQNVRINNLENLIYDAVEARKNGTKNGIE